MQAAMKHWLYSFEYPHNRHEWLQETRSMMHDTYFGQALGWVLVLCLLVTLIMIMFMPVPGSSPELEWEPNWYEFAPVAGGS